MTKHRKMNRGPFGAQRANPQALIVQDNLAKINDLVDELLGFAEVHLRDAPLPGLVRRTSAIGALGMEILDNGKVTPEQAFIIATLAVRLHEAERGQS